MKNWRGQLHIRKHHVKISEWMEFLRRFNLVRRHAAVPNLGCACLPIPGGGSNARSSRTPNSRLKQALTDSCQAPDPCIHAICPGAQRSGCGCHGVVCLAHPSCRVLPGVWPTGSVSKLLQSSFVQENKQFSKMQKRLLHCLAQHAEQHLSETSSEKLPNPCPDDEYHPALKWRDCKKHLL